MKKSLVALMTTLMVMSIPTFAFANTEATSAGDVEMAVAVENPVVLDCGKFSYTLNELSEDDATVVRTKNGSDTIEYKIYNSTDPTIVDTIRVNFVPTSVSTRASNGNDIRSTFFSRYQSIVNTKTNKEVVKVEFSTRVDFYESGSFRSFYAADTPNLTINSPITPMSLANVAKSIKSSTGKYPTTSLTYAYSANLKTSTTVSATASAQLPGAGFSVSTGSTTCYYRTVKNTGTISLY